MLILLMTAAQSARCRDEVTGTVAELCSRRGLGPGILCIPRLLRSFPWDLDCVFSQAWVLPVAAQRGITLALQIRLFIVLLSISLLSLVLFLVWVLKL